MGKLRAEGGNDRRIVDRKICGRAFIFLSRLFSVRLAGASPRSFVVGADLTHLQLFEQFFDLFVGGRVFEEALADFAFLVDEKVGGPDFDGVGGFGLPAAAV